MRKTIMLCVALCGLSQGLYGQGDTSPVAEYRRMAVEYNKDLKSAEKSISASIELLKSAKDDMKPMLNGGANFQYVGNPTKLTIDLPGTTNPTTFQGESVGYGAAISLMQPVYTGGRVLELIKLSQSRQSLYENQFDVIHSAVCFQADVQYWNTVASVEFMSLFDESYNSILKLRQIVKDRVEVGVADPQDLLMVEVKLNNSHYQLLKSQNDAETNRMALNSLIGNSLDTEIDIESEVDKSVTLDFAMERTYRDRAEIKVAQDKISISQSELRINDSKYKPQFHVGAEGGFYSPGYNFKSDINPNYTLYAKLSVPIFTWGKRQSDKRAYQYNIGIAQDNLSKVKDDVFLEEQQAKVNLSQSIQRVNLTSNSLEKAEENETKAIERYNEGKCSVVEVIDAQIYRLTTQINFVQAKLAMQIGYAELLKSVNGYSMK